MRFQLRIFLVFFILVASYSGALGVTSSKFSDETTNLVIYHLNEVRRVCSSLPLEYRVDCLGDGLAWASGCLPRSPDYRAARSILAKAGNKIQALKISQDRTKKPIRSVASRVWKGSKNIKALEASSIPGAAVQALAIIQEAETQLLRSTENSERRRVHYRRIAIAVGGTARVLRS